MTKWGSYEKYQHGLNHINKLKLKNVIIPTDSEKLFDKIKYLFRVKKQCNSYIHTKIRIGGNFLNLI